MLEKLIKAVCPDFPEDRSVRETHDRMAWYLVGNTPPVLRVPPVDYLKRNMMELDRFAEAVRAFAISDISSKEYDWDNLSLREYSGTECCEALKSLRNLIAGRRVAIDIETRRIEYEDNKLLSIGFAISENECWAFYNVPIQGTNYSGEPLPPKVIHDTYKALQEVLSIPDTTYIWHNGKFDVNRLKYLCNLDARVDEDTMLKHYACINEKRGTHG